MNHPDLDELLGLVRDEPVGDDVHRHVDGCDQCSADRAAAARLDAVADVIGPEPGSHEIAPPSSVWDRIQADLLPSVPVVLAPSTSPRRSRRLPVLAASVAAAAAAGIVLGGIVGYLVGDEGSSPDRAAATPVAVATLRPVGQDTVSADVAMSRAGRARSMTITFSAAVPGPGYVEAWLLDPVTNEMLGLGVLGADGGTVVVPPGADLERFTTVDVSREPFDGDPAHSADSIVRGVLVADPT